jgi:glycine cleavage system aminomethyltransferase T
MVDWKKDFIGKEALLKQKEQGLTKRLGTFIFEDKEIMPWGDEPIFMNGEVIGYTSSATFAHSVDSGLCLGYVNHSNVQTKGFIGK